MKHGSSLCKTRGWQIAEETGRMKAVDIETWSAEIAELSQEMPLLKCQSIRVENRKIHFRILKREFCLKTDASSFHYEFSSVCFKIIFTCLEAWGAYMRLPRLPIWTLWDSVSDF